MNQARDLPTRGFQLPLGSLAEIVDAGSVTIHLTETQRERLLNFGSDGGCGVVVEIKALHVISF
jgi:hypothetical protein